MNRYEFYSNLQTYKKQHEEDSLSHYGILGQKWGTRRWQNADGTFNAAGKERYFGSKGNKKEKADEKTGKSSKNKWPMNDLFKKAGYDYDNSDDETRELFEIEVNDIRNSYKNGNDINKLSKKFGYDKNFIQDVINSDPDQKIGSFKVNFKKSSDNSDLGTRTFYTRDEYNKTLNKLDNKYGDNYYPTMSNDEYRKMYEETPMYGQNKKVGGLFNKKAINENGQEYNPKYQYPWGGLKEEGEKLLEKNPKKFNKKVNTELYERDKKYNEDIEVNKENNKKIFDENIDLINEIGKKYGYAENGIKNVNSKSNGKIQVRTPVTEEPWYDFEHQYYEVPDIDNKVKKVDPSKVEKDFQKYNKFIENFDNIYNKAINSTAQVYYDRYKELSENPVSFEEFRDSIKISPYEGNKPVYIHSDDIVGDQMNLFLKSDIPNSPGSFSMTSDLDGNLKYTNSFDENYRKTGFDADDQKIGGLFNKTPEEKAEKKAAKEAKRINDELEEEYLYDRRHWDEVANAYINESEFSPLFENIRKSNNEKLSKDYDKVNDIFKDYLENEDEYVTRAAIASSIIDEETTLENIGRMTRLYLMDDLDQGYANSSDLYARYEKNIDDKEIERLYRSLYYNKDMYNENVKYLKDNNKVLSKVNDALLLELCKENEDEHNTARKNEAYWCLYDAADGSSHNGDLEKDAYNKAKKITEKLHKSCSGNDGWYYLNQAIENLDLNSTELRNMTQADWDKINAEINKLKK